MNNKIKKGFTLVELMLLFLFLSMVIAASTPIITKRVRELPLKVPHGKIVCENDNANPGKYIKTTYISGVKINTESNLDKCTFTPPKKSSLFRVELVGAGAGGYNEVEAWDEQDGSISNFKFTYPYGWDNNNYIARPTEAQMYAVAEGLPVQISTNYYEAGSGRGFSRQLAIPENVECPISTKNHCAPDAREGSLPCYYSPGSGNGIPEFYQRVAPDGKSLEIFKDDDGNVISNRFDEVQKREKNLKDAIQGHYLLKSETIDSSLRSIPTPIAGNPEATSYMSKPHFYQRIYMGDYSKHKDALRKLCRDNYLDLTYKTSAGLIYATNLQPDKHFKNIVATDDPIVWPSRRMFVDAGMAYPLVYTYKIHIPDDKKNKTYKELEKHYQLYLSTDDSTKFAYRAGVYVNKDINDVLIADNSKANDKFFIDYPYLFLAPQYPSYQTTPDNSNQYFVMIEYKDGQATIRKVTNKDSHPLWPHDYDVYKNFDPATIAAGKYRIEDFREKLVPEINAEDGAYNGGDIPFRVAIRMSDGSILATKYSATGSNGVRLHLCIPGILGRAYSVDELYYPEHIDSMDDAEHNNGIERYQTRDDDLYCNYDPANGIDDTGLIKYAWYEIGNSNHTGAAAVMNYNGLSPSTQSILRNKPILVGYCPTGLTSCEAKTAADEYNSKYNSNVGEMGIVKFNYPVTINGNKESYEHQVLYTDDYTSQNMAGYPYIQMTSTMNVRFHGVGKSGGRGEALVYYAHSLGTSDCDLLPGRPGQPVDDSTRSLVPDYENSMKSVLSCAEGNIQYSAKGGTYRYGYHQENPNEPVVSLYGRSATKLHKLGEGITKLETKAAPGEDSDYNPIELFANYGLSTESKYGRGGDGPSIVDTCTARYGDYILQGVNEKTGYRSEVSSHYEASSGDVSCRTHLAVGDGYVTKTDAKPGTGGVVIVTW